MTELHSDNNSVKKSLAILLLALIIAGFTVFLALGLVGKSTATGRSGEKLIDIPPPSFGGREIQGGFFSLDEHKGSPLIINFWASWCPPCREETPDIEEIWKTYKDQGLVVVGVNVQDIEEEAEKYLSEFSVTFPNVMDKQGKITVDYGVTGLPVTFFVSREGLVIGRWVGSISEERLDSWVAFLMEGDSNSSASSGNNNDGFSSLN